MRTVRKNDMKDKVKFNIHLTEEMYVETELFLPDAEEFEDMSEEEITDAINRRIENAFMTWIDCNMWWEIVKNEGE